MLPHNRRAETALLLAASLPAIFQLDEDHAGERERERERGEGRGGGGRVDVPGKYSQGRGRSKRGSSRRLRCRLRGEMSLSRWRKVLAGSRYFSMPLTTDSNDPYQWLYGG